MEFGFIAVDKHKTSRIHIYIERKDLLLIQVILQIESRATTSKVKRLGYTWRDILFG